MQVKIYSFSKKNNSTKQPGSSAGVVHNCKLKNDCSIINPIIEFERFSSASGEDISPSDYNYAYISSFGRYYYIDNWSFSDGKWIAYMNVDVLASFKTDIGSCEAYVLRASSRYDDDIRDNLYLATNDVSYAKDVGSGTVSNLSDNASLITNFFSKPYTSGYVVMGIIGKYGIDYYGMTVSVFTNILRGLLEIEPQDVGDIARTIARSILDVLQYVQVCYWYPNKPAGNTLAQSLWFGVYELQNVPCIKLSSSNFINQLSYQISLSAHPQLSHDGMTDFYFLNTSPYTKRTLVFEPFGSFDLDTSVLMKGTFGINCRIFVDYTTGIADLYVYDSALHHLLASKTAEFGVKINVSQETINVLGLGRALIGEATSLAGFGLTLNPSYLLSAAGSAISGQIDSAPRLKSLGANGSFIAFNAQEAEVFTTFYNITGTSSSIYGRPLYTPQHLNTLSGYILCDKVALDIECTKQEKDKILSYLTSGFYYE